MAITYVGVGTNIGDREANIKMAIESLNLLPETKIIKTSKIYETEPWGYEEQDSFLNGVLCVETTLTAHTFLGALLGIEASMGRIRKIKNGPRIIDLDLLYYDNEVHNEEELTLPHPRIMERAFVLVPLADVKNDEKVITALEKIDKSGVIEYKNKE